MKKWKGTVAGAVVGFVLGFGIEELFGSGVVGSTTQMLEQSLPIIGALVGFAASNE